MDKKIVRYQIDKMPYQPGETMGVYIRKNNDVVGISHIHDCYEIEIIVDGHIDEIINAVSYTASHGDAFLLTPNDFHQLTDIKDVEIYNIMFKEDVINKGLLQTLCDLSLSTNVHCKFTEEEYNYIASLLERAIYEYKNRAQYYDTILFNTVNTVIALILRKCDLPVSNEIKESPIRKAMVFLQLHCQENPTLEDVARYVSLNPTYLSVKFHSSTGKTFKNYLTELKLNRARQSLLMTDMPVAEVCFASGFSSLSNFHREFKKFYGVSPQSLRKSNNKSEI